MKKVVLHYRDISLNLYNTYMCLGCFGHSLHVVLTVSRWRVKTSASLTLSKHFSFHNFNLKLLNSHFIICYSATLTT